MESIAANISWRALLIVGVFLPITGLISFYIYSTPNTWKDGRRKHLPPGPRGIPFIGNFLDLADDQTIPSKAIAWAKTHGDVFYTKIGGSDWIWLSSPQAIRDLMDKRSAIYSSRPPAPMVQDVASGGRRQLFMQYGLAYRVVRKISHALLNVNTSISYQPVQDFESKQLLKEILSDPDNFYDYNRRYSASVIIRVTYGYRIPNWNDPLIKKIYSVLWDFNEMTRPGGWLIETFPSLKILPEWMVGNWRTYGKGVFERTSKVYLGLWRELREKVDKGVAPACFCKDFMTSDFEKQGMDELQAAYQAGGLVEAGAETTSAFLNLFIRNMVLNPEAVRKAQAELDGVMGADRMPNFDDENDLPYVRAIIKENLRMYPPNKLGMNHATTQDDWYDGHFIPGGSVIILNWFAVHYNEKLYPEPFSFKPERYLASPLPAAAYVNITDPYERDHFSYGAGRRVCPGIHVAERSMFINMARMLWAFNFPKKVGPGGKIIEPDTATLKGWMMVPKKFLCDMTVRSDKHASIIRKAFSDAEARGLEYDFEEAKKKPSVAASKAYDLAG